MPTRINRKKSHCPCLRWLGILEDLELQLSLIKPLIKLVASPGPVLAPDTYN